MYNDSLVIDPSDKSTSSSKSYIIVVALLRTYNNIQIYARVVEVK